MPYYVTLGNWTDQGIKSVKDVPKRIEAARALIAKHGGKLITMFITMGKYDFVAISESPSDEVVMEWTLTLGMQGNARTTTLKGWAAPEAAKVIAKLPELGHKAPEPGHKA